MNLSEMNKEQLLGFKGETEQLYNDFKAKGLCLNMARGNPCKEQLDLTVDMLRIFDDNNFLSENGTDVRNYGLLDGIPEAKKLFSDMIGVGTGEAITFEKGSIIVDRYGELINGGSVHCSALQLSLLLSVFPTSSYVLQEITTISLREYFRLPDLQCKE